MDRPLHPRSQQEVLTPLIPARKSIMIATALTNALASLVYRHLRECAAEDYDVIAIGKLDWAMLPDEQRLQLLEKVWGGG
jgi:hypothetical protein